MKLKRSVCSFCHVDFSEKWFLCFQVKSMAQYLETADKFFYPRKERFHERYLDDVSALVNSVTLEIIRKQEKVTVLFTVVYCVCVWLLS